MSQDKTNQKQKISFKKILTNNYCCKTNKINTDSLSVLINDGFYGSLSKNVKILGGKRGLCHLCQDDLILKLLIILF